MQDFFTWSDARTERGRPWLILGKGPSFSKRGQFDLGRFYTLSLNHAVRELPVTVAHMIDYNVVDACGEAILKNAEYLVLPWIPHVNNRPGAHNLEELARINPVLRQMNAQGRLLWYNHSRARQRREGSPVVRVKFFSAVAALNLLAQAGVRTVRSLGVDGGASYSRDFEDLADKTLLANRRMSFDIQFEEIARTILTTGIDYAPLDIPSPVRVFVGATEAQMLAVKVLEYSIRKHASMAVDVMPLNRSAIAIPEPKEVRNRARTPFSFQRFLIPQLMGYQGKAIYLDSDMLMFKDIRALWELPFDGAELLAARQPGHQQAQFSVMLLNCESLKWNIQEIIGLLDAGDLTYEQLVYEMRVVKKIAPTIDPEWNSLESFTEGKMAVLHYTDMGTQPWTSRANTLGHLWTRHLFEAVDLWFISPDFVREHVASGNIRPSLLFQLEHRLEDSFLLSRKARLMDGDFIPSHRAAPEGNSSPWLQPAKLLRAAARYCYRNSLVSRWRRHLHHLPSK